jgi:Fur family transcriptional regulator, ferric uptake regulator
MSSINQFTSMLKASGQSVTKSRVAIFEALLGKEPMSMHDLVGKVRGVDRASVYRSIELFERLGIVQRLHTGWKYKLELSDKFNEHHHHLSCVRCGRTTAMNESELELIIRRIAAHHGFWPSSHQIEVQGLCAECRANQPAREHS